MKIQIRYQSGEKAPMSDAEGADATEHDKRKALLDDLECDYQ